MYKTKAILSYKPLFDKKIMMITKYTIYNIDKNINKIYSKRTNKKTSIIMSLSFLPLIELLDHVNIETIRENKNL